MTTKTKKESAPRRYQGHDPYSIVGLEVNCTSCRKTLPAAAFSRNRREVNRFGLAYRCRECDKASAERRRAMPVAAKSKRVPQLARELYAEGRKQCVGACGRVLDHEAFGPDRQTWDNLRGTCRQCHAGEQRNHAARIASGVGLNYSADAAAEHALLAMLELEVGDLEDGAEVIDMGEEVTAWTIPRRS